MSQCTWKIRWCGFVLAWCVLVPTVAAAQESAGTVDLFRGPVVSSSRVIGMGGAYAGVAEGVQGVGRNAASLGNRYPYSTDWFDWDITLDWVNLVPGDGVDMDNDGVTSGDEEFQALNLGLALLFGKFGIGVWVTGDTYRLAGDREQIEYGFVRGFLGLTYAFWREQLVLGAGLSTASLDVRTYANRASPGERPDWQEEGDKSWGDASGQLAVLWKPRPWPLRVGLDLRFANAVGTDEEGMPEAVATVAVPRQLYVPWRLALGASYYHSFAGHPYNLARQDPRNPFAGQARDDAADGEATPVDRRYVLASLDLVLHGPAPVGAVGTAAFAAGRQRESGQDPSLSLHAGVESEFWNNRMAARMGTYLEPPRLSGAAYRVHGTVGAEIRLFKLWRWQFRAGASLDAARDYLNWGLGVGFWH